MVTTAAELIANENMPKAQLKDIPDATHFGWGHNDVSNYDAADNDASESPSNPTQEYVEAAFGNFIEQVKTDGSEGADVDHCHTIAFSIKQLEYGDWPRRLFVEASAGTGKRNLLANVVLWLKEVHKDVRHSNSAA